LSVAIAESELFDGIVLAVPLGGFRGFCTIQQLILLNEILQYADDLFLRLRQLSQLCHWSAISAHVPLKLFVIYTKL
jgi:hypothetical protein